jgi:acyl-coenzyme A synthetase/AMP-(fatty) acid ligase
VSAPNPAAGLNLATAFLDSNLASGRGGRTALTGPAGAVTYAELSDLTNRVGNALLELGVRAQQRVLLALADSVAFVAAWYAVQKIGAVTAEVYTFLQPKDYTYYLDYTEAVVVIVDAATLDRMRVASAASRGRATLLVVNAGDIALRNGEVPFESLVLRQPADLVAAPAADGDIAIWKFTTGSTGKPKACVHTARSPMVSFDGYARGVLDFRVDDIVLPVPKLFFGYARDLAALFPFGVGATGVIFAERPSPEPSAPEQDLRCLRLCTSAGEALPEPLHHRWNDTFGVEVLDGIGSSEAYHIYISNRPGRVRPGSIGEVVPGYAAEVVDDAGDPLPDGQIGRLWIRGKSASLMYWHDEGASAATFGRDLVMSGDLVERDADGYFLYRGRSDDLLKVGGIWVAPAEIERCLVTHPDVVECAVVAAERDGLTHGCAYVVLKPDAAATPEALRDFVRERLAPHKVPRDVRVVPALPRTGSGKIDRTALRGLVPAGETGGRQA